MDDSVNKLANVFKYDVDFVEDLHPGDTFEVVYEDQWREGQRLKNGDVLAARITSNAAFLTGMRRVCEGGGVALYKRDFTAQAASLR